MTAAPADDPEDAFRKALEADAGIKTEDVPEIPAPPRRLAVADPEAPHGRDESGNPLAPYGIGRNGRPRIKPGGPGRGGKQEQARVEEPAAEPAAQPAQQSGGPDFTAELSGLGTTAWLVLSSMRGGRLGLPLVKAGIPLPDTRPYAAMLDRSLPDMVVAWNQAAKQNKTVRGYVQKLSGEGSWAWVIGVTVTTAGFVGACSEMAGAKPEIRAQWAEHNDAEFKKFKESTMAEMGLQGQAA